MTAGLLRIEEGFDPFALLPEHTTPLIDSQLLRMLAEFFEQS